ncbi:MAG: hypothetical protein JWP87_246, partial [Labilithrix sp.]|nr:hypothetical protein [Labilithrix sp.]
MQDTALRLDALREDLKSFGVAAVL